jgi:hypothetical protein
LSLKKVSAGEISDDKLGPIYDDVVTFSSFWDLFLALGGAEVYVLRSDPGWTLVLWRAPFSKTFGPINTCHAVSTFLSA